jgi:hypothetical protein
VRACHHCGLDLAGKRPNAWFCSDRCRLRAFRRRHASPEPRAENAYPDGARRGRLPLGAPLTRAELEAIPQAFRDRWVAAEIERAIGAVGERRA